jgi:drug/metabolite transporter (DMT)-like permease
LKNRLLFSWLLLLFLTVIWGLSFIFIKKIVLVLTPLELGAARVFTASFFLLPWAISGLKKTGRKELKWIAASGVLGNLLPAFIFSLAGSRVNSSMVGTLNSTTPIFVLIIGVLFFAAQVKRNHIAGIALGFAGSFILILSGNTGELNFGNPYAWVIMLATFFYGFSVNIISKYLKHIPPVRLTAVAFFIVGIFALVILLFTGFFTKILLPENREILYYLLILAGVNTSLALVLFNYLLQITNPVFASSVTYLMPLVAMTAGFFDGERISILHITGMVVILAGVYIINYKPKEKLLFSERN